MHLASDKATTITTPERPFDVEYSICDGTTAPRRPVDIRRKVDIIKKGTFAPDRTLEASPQHLGPLFGSHRVTDLAQATRGAQDSQSSFHRVIVVIDIGETTGE